MVKSNEKYDNKICTDNDKTCWWKLWSIC